MTTINILDFANEILIAIFSYLTEIERYRTLGTCKKWNILACDRILRPNFLSINPHIAFLQCCVRNLILSFDDIVNNVCECNHIIYNIGAKTLLWTEGMMLVCKLGHSSMMKKVLKLDPKYDFMECLQIAIARGYYQIIEQLLLHHTYNQFDIEKLIKEHDIDNRIIQLLITNCTIHENY